MAAVPLRTRAVGVAAVLLAAPLFAEVVQSYLDSTGALGETLFLVVLLAPLYGGAGLLVREVAVRTGMGWSGRLMLALAFGVLMPTLVDRSLYTPQTAEEIATWGDYLGSSLVGGISMSAVLTWSVGHAVMSVGAPLAVVEGLLPDGRDRPWLGGVGLGVVAALGLGVAALIRSDAPEGPVPDLSIWHDTVPVAVAAALVLLALSRWGRPVPKVADRRSPGAGWVAAGGFVLMAGFDFAPVSWAGVALGIGALLVAAVGTAWLARSPSWGWTHVTALAYGALLERTVIGFLAPLPPGADAGGRVVQNVVVLMLVLGLGVLARARLRREREPVGAS